MFHRRGSPITPPSLVQRRELNLMAHSTGLTFTGLILASITLQTSLNLLLADALRLPFKTRSFTLAVGPL
jgi:hypothetical protein